MMLQWKIESSERVGVHDFQELEEVPFGMGYVFVQFLEGRDVFSLFVHAWA